MAEGVSVDVGIVGVSVGVGVRVSVGRVIFVDVGMCVGGVTVGV